VNRKQRRSQSRSKSITRKAGLTYLTVAGVVGGSLGVVAPVQARLAPQNYVATDCVSLKNSLLFTPEVGPATGLVATGGTLTADFSGTCDFAEGYVFDYASTITGPADGSLTLNFTGTATAFATYENFAVSNLRFTQSDDAGIVSFVYGETRPEIGSLVSQQFIAPSITVSNSTFSNATVSSAIYAEGNLTVSDSVFRNFTAYSDGGAIASFGTTNISNTTFDSIETNGNGGAIYSDTSLFVSDSTFSNVISLDSEYPGDGGAIFSWNDSTITNSSFSGNSSTSSGGAVWHAGSLTVSGSSFIGNTSVSGGGAIKSYGEGSSIDNSTFSENNVIGPNDGAALSLSEGSVGNFISNSTFWNNGDRNSESIESENPAYFFGNILANSTSGVELFTTRGIDVTTEEAATNFDLGANLYTDDSFVDTTTGDGSSQLASIDQLKLNDPALNTTGLINTGKTKTVAIGAGSIARDYYSATSAGINPTGVSTIGDGAFTSRLATLDQRGVARPTGSRIDVGAYEAGDDPVVVTEVLVPAVTPAVVAKATIAAQGINFAPGSSKLSSASKKKLRTLAAEIQAKGLKTVNLEGYTATLTKAAPSGKVLRVKLSKARATAVEKYLKQQFKKSGYSVTFTKSPKGAANRVKSNQTEKGRADNRRVEITIN
jgi:outer membrane protein OmpA-like peptidoglycan-associated protein